MSNPLLSGLFGFCLLGCAYAAQYWAYRSHQELKKMNEKLDRMLVAPPRQE